MAIKLSKGQKIDLTKSNPLLNKVLIGLGWKAGSNVDLDTAAFLLRADGRVESDEDFVFYGNLRHKSGAVEHSGDNTTGGYGDAEQIHIDLKRVPEYIAKIDFTATIYDAQSRRQNFGMVHEAYIRVVDESSEQELLRFDLGENFSVETAIVVGEIYRHKGNWKFNAIGAGFSGGLAALCKNFGVDVDDETSTHGSAQSSSNQPSNAQPKQIVMEKWQQFNLVKNGNSYGAIILDFQSKSTLSGHPMLYCIYETAVEAFGNTYKVTEEIPDEDRNLGFFNREPFIAKDNNAELVRINGAHPEQFSRVIVAVEREYSQRWESLDGVLNIRCEGNPEIVIRLDETGFGNNCVLATIENVNGVFRVEKIVKFYSYDSDIKDDFNIE